MTIDVDLNTVFSIQSDSDSRPNMVKAKADKNVHLKGRRRYNADLNDIEEECSDGFVQQGYIIKSRWPSAVDELRD